MLDDDYGLDSQTVYLEDRPIPGADASTFGLVPNSTFFAKDRHRLYVKRGSHFHYFDEIDVQTLVANGDFVADKDNLFHLGETLSRANDQKDRALVGYSLHDEHDMRLKDWLLKHHGDVVGWWHPDDDGSAKDAEPFGGPWYRSATAVFHHETLASMRGTDEVFHRLAGADPAAFSGLDEQHARDTRHVFCRWRRIAGADPATFVALGGLVGRDARAVYFNGYCIEGADPGRFTVWPTARAYGKDDQRVYTTAFARTSHPFGHPDDVLVPLDGADPTTFQAFGERGAWAADARTVYLRGERKTKLDAASFRFLGETSTNSWAQDDAGVYRANGTLAVAGLDGATFRKLNDVWGTDGKVVFCFVTGAIQKAIDAASFVVTDEAGGAEDATFVYRLERGAIRKRKR
ncbi:DKNYY domain-containing protein [Achromobacter sp. GG226]|nr:DKNYY domain-containing protein [Verticiella sp. GG226]